MWKSIPEMMNQSKRRLWWSTRDELQTNTLILGSTDPDELNKIRVLWFALDEEQDTIQGNKKGKGVERARGRALFR